MPKNNLPTAASGQSEPTAAARRSKRWPLWIIAIIVALTVLLAGLALLAVQTDWGTRFLWQGASRVLSGQLSGEFAGGRLRDGVTLRNVVYRDDTKVIKIDRLESKWDVSFSPLTLTVQWLHIDTTEVTLLPSPPTPRTLPRQITLPLAVALREATIEQVNVHQDASTSRYRDIRLQATSDKVQHSVTLENAVTPYGKLSAALQLNGMAPFALAGAATLSGTVEKKSYRIDARISGTLAALGVQLDAAGDKLTGQATIEATPFDTVPLQRAHIDLRHLDPKTFNAAWPQADLAIKATITPVTPVTPTGPTPGSLPDLVVAGPVSITNAKPGPIDSGLLPLVSASTMVQLNRQLQQLAQISIQLPGKGRLTGSGEIRGAAGALTLQASRLDLHALHTALRPSQLSGPLVVRLAEASQYIDVKLSDPAFSVSANAELGPKQIVLHTATLQAGAAQLAVSGTLARDALAAYSVSGKLTDFNPALFLSSSRPASAKNRAASGSNINARINTDFQAQGALRPELTAQVRFKVYDSMYDKLPMTGGGTLHLVGKRLLPSDAQLSIAGNTMLLKGSFGAPGDVLKVDINAPRLNRLGFALSGLLLVNGQIGGTLERPVMDATYRAEKLVLGAHRLDFLSGAAHTRGVPGTTPEAQVTLYVKARGLHSGDIDLNSLTATIDGTYARHSIRLDSSGRWQGQPLELTLAAQGRLRQLPQGLAWDGVLRMLENRVQPRLLLGAPMSLTIAPGRIELGATRLTLAQATIDLKSFYYSAGQIRSEGAATALDIGHLLALRKQYTGEAPPFLTDLVLDGSWNVTLADNASGFVQIARRSGDIRVIGESTLGLTALSLRADLQASRVNLDMQAKASRIGTVSGQGQIGLQRLNGRLGISPQSPLSGRVHASMPSLQTIASLAGPSIALNGSIDTVLTLAGTLGQPVVSGTLTGDDLTLTLYDQGIRLRDGIVRLNLTNNVVELQHLQFRGGDGTLRATGSIPLDRASGDLRATVVADKLQLLANPSGQLTVSGQASAANVNQQLLVSGKFVVDQARFTLPENPAPQLSDDVVVIRGDRRTVPADNTAAARAQKPAGPYTPKFNIALDLGNNFLFVGSGADVRLAGTLNLQSEPGLTPQAYGTVRVVEGSYEAFGTNLSIERGIINFQGSLRNPNINILAMRRNQAVAAGVQVSGYAQQPRIQLVSEPNVSREDKLSWLVFGRGSGGNEGGQAQTAVRGATVGLINQFGGKRLAKTFGLDTFTIGASEFGLDGAQVVNLGKDISDRFYVGYEQSLAGAESVLKLTYVLSKSWSVVLRGGTVTGVEILYSNRFDSRKSAPPVKAADEILPAAAPVKSADKVSR